MPIKKKTTTKTIKTKKTEKKDFVSSKVIEGKKEKKYFLFATGKRKSAIAQVRFSPNGSGQIIINGKDYKEYFRYFVWQEIVLAPLETVNLKNYEIKVKVIGGGVRAQAESVRLGIAKALVEFNPDLRKILKPKGYLSRDPRVKERKKPGLKRARRAPQWAKR